MKYLLSLVVTLMMASGILAQQQLELILPVGISGLTASTEENFRQANPESTFTFGQGASTGAFLRYTFGLQNRFHIAAALGYQRWNMTYSRTTETTEPDYLLRTTDYTYTDHSILGGLNIRYRLIEDRSQGLALQAKTYLGFPFTGEYRLEDSRLFDPQGEPVVSDAYINDLIYLDDSNMHLQIGGGMIYTYHFSKWSLIAEVNYLYKYHLTGHARSDGFAIDWQDVNLGVGVGYILGGGDKIEGNQDAFFKKK